jgi:hypothetical protein|uniref:Uncharacterized protein n=1 Tax=Picea glauca TaxID=3330 RepID=A0A101M420_PICGL|nr:hypothetical protein ABT39_MTgene449 [Picea glauca]QHR88191.1 hypothetical protein Q903MT_gene2204 [Picea sitchensis]
MVKQSLKRLSTPTSLSSSRSRSTYSIRFRRLDLGGMLSLGKLALDLPQDLSKQNKLALRLGKMQLLMVVVNLLIRLNQSNQLATLMLPPVMVLSPGQWGNPLMEVDLELKLMLVALLLSLPIDAKTPTQGKLQGVPGG